MEEHMKSKMHIVFTAVTVLLITVLMSFPAAHAADGQYQVNGKTITCTVTDIQYDSLGVWNNFTLKYEFCSGNRVTLRCIAWATDSLITDEVGCVKGSEPLTQACNGATYTFRPNTSRFPLTKGTIGAQAYVCNEQFKLMTVTVETLK